MDVCVLSPQQQRLIKVSEVKEISASVQRSPAKEPNSYFVPGRFFKDGGAFATSDQLSAWTPVGKFWSGSRAEHKQSGQTVRQQNRHGGIHYGGSLGGKNHGRLDFSRLIIQLV